MRENKGNKHCSGSLDRGCVLGREAAGQGAGSKVSSTAGKRAVSHVPHGYQPGDQIRQGSSLLRRSKLGSRGMLGSRCAGADVAANQPRQMSATRLLYQPEEEASTHKDT